MRINLFAKGYYLLYNIALLTLVTFKNYVLILNIYCKEIEAVGIIFPADFSFYKNVSEYHTGLERGIVEERHLLTYGW